MIKIMTIKEKTKAIKALSNAMAELSKNGNMNEINSAKDFLVELINSLKKDFDLHQDWE